jgi:hypothetical protein
LTTINHGIFCLRINKNVAVMDYNVKNIRYPEELVSHSFLRELEFLEKLKYYSWCPEIINIDQDKRLISFKWYHNTSEDVISNNYKEQLLQITKDLHKEQLIKPNFYKKYFYLDNNNKMHTYAFYSTSTYKEQPININFYRPILNAEREQLVNKLAVNNLLDMRILLKYAYENYIDWPDNPLPRIYKEVYND